MRKNPLPPGFGASMKSFIAQGMKPKDAMREAWKVARGGRKNSPKPFKAYLTKEDINWNNRYKDLISKGISPKEAERIATKEYEEKKRKTRKNPIAIFNPLKTCPECGATKTKHGQPYTTKKQLSIHRFEQHGIKKKNPPRSGSTIYQRALEIKAWSRDKGFRVHKFSPKSEVRIIGNADGSITLRSAKGLKLYAKESEL